MLLGFSLVTSMIGFIFAAGTIWNDNLMYLQSYSWLIGAFVSSLTYYLFKEGWKGLNVDLSKISVVTSNT